MQFCIYGTDILMPGCLIKAIDIHLLFIITNNLGHKNQLDKYLHVSLIQRVFFYDCHSDY